MYAAALIDNHPILRLGLARILGNIATIREVRTYDPEYISGSSPPSESGLDVQILLFGLSGDKSRDQELLRRMIELTAPKSVLLLAETAGNPSVSHPLVAGRVRKSASSDLIEAAVRLIMAGGRCFPSDCDSEEMAEPQDAVAVYGSTTEHGGMAGWPTPGIIAASARTLRITPRQFEILMLRARGFSHKAVGQMLNISEATVKAHASAMYRRLDVSTRQEAVRIAAEKGIHFLLPQADQDDKQRR